MNLFDLIKIAADMVIIPLCAILWGMQGRLSRIEGQLNMMQPHHFIHHRKNDNET